MTINNNQHIIHQRREIIKRLSKRQIKEAVEILTKMSVNLKQWQASEKLNELETNYKFMLHYFFEGIEDPEQKTIYNNFLRTLYELADDIPEELLMDSSHSLYYEKLRLRIYHGNTHVSDYHKQLKDIYDSLSLTSLIENPSEKESRIRDLSVKRERIASEIFDIIFVSPRADEMIIKGLKNLFNDEGLQEREKCLFISALNLNLFQRFDSVKVNLLIELCRNSNPKVSQRAIVGLIISLQMYDERWKYYPECGQMLESLSEDTAFRKSVATVIRQLIQSRETEKISRKITEEIIPEMMRFNSLAGKKLNMEELMGLTDDFSEKNPEWKKELQNSGLADKLQEYSNLQLEGADVFHSTFANLKSFPFFSELSNWFLPFDITYSELQKLFNNADKDSLLYTAILASGHMCNSDKYSFSLSLLQIPESQREMMLQRFGAESEEIKQLQKEAMELNPNINQEVISNQYIQDLYRFYKVHPARKGFTDIFSMSIDFYNNRSIFPLISNPEDMRQIALYYFNKNFFRESLEIYERIVDIDQEDASAWQKIAYSRQMLKDYRGALQAYLQADLLNPNHTWTMKRIAQLYRSLKMPELALEYYLKIQAVTKENISIDLNIGHTYLDLKEYDKALNTYFKVELADGGDNPKAWRPIAWTAFLLRKFDLSQNYYQKIISANPTVHDYLNAGHVELVLDNRRKAMNYYSEALAALDKEDINEFIELFMADKNELTEAGIKEEVFPLLFDELRFKRD